MTHVLHESLPSQRTTLGSPVYIQGISNGNIVDHKFTNLNTIMFSNILFMTRTYSPKIYIDFDKILFNMNIWETSDYIAIKKKQQHPNDNHYGLKWNTHADMQSCGLSHYSYNGSLTFLFDSLWNHLPRSHLILDKYQRYDMDRLSAAQPRCVNFVKQLSVSYHTKKTI